MKIAFCTHRFVPPLVGGVDVYTDRLRQALERLGHEVIILALDSTVDTNSGAITVCPTKFNDTKIWRLRFAFAKRPKQTFDQAYDPEMGATIKAILQEQKPDLFIIMNFYTVTLASVEAAKDLGIPVIHIATDFVAVCRRSTFIRWDGTSCQMGESIKSCSTCFISHWLLGKWASSVFNKLPEATLIKWANNKRNAYKPPHPLWILKPYLKQVEIMDQRLKIIRPLREKIDLVLVANRYILNVFLTNGFKPDQTRLLPFAIETNNSLARLKRIPAPHVRFLFIGRFQPYKGAHLLVEAFNNLQSPKKATLTLYGVPDGYDTYFNQLQAMMASNDRIQFAGKIAPTALADAFARSDLFVLPSTWHENSPLILLDALQSKTPVIASNIGGVIDVVKDGVNGLLFPMGDKYALQQVMQRVIDQPHLIKQLGLGIQLPTIEDYAQTMVEFCQDRLISPVTKRSGKL